MCRRPNAQQKANAEVAQRANVARLACENQFPNAHVKKVDCLTQAENTILRPVYRYGDLLDLFQAQRKRIAVKIDLGEIQLDDAMVEYAQTRVSLVEGRSGSGTPTSPPRASTITAARGRRIAQLSRWPIDAVTTCCEIEENAHHVAAFHKTDLCGTRRADLSYGPLGGRRVIHRPAGPCFP
jgi:hypothetical protein